MTSHSKFVPEDSLNKIMYKIYTLSPPDTKQRLLSLAKAIARLGRRRATINGHKVSGYYIPNTWFNWLKTLYERNK